MDRKPPRRPFSLVTGCVLGAAGVASAVTVVFMRFMFASAMSSSPAGCEAATPTAAAEVSGLRVFDLAMAEYDELEALSSAETLSGYEAELRWGTVRDRYRLFLAYPEAVARWPELAELARGRADQIDELVSNLAQMQTLEIQAKQLEWAQAEMAAAAKATAHAQMVAQHAALAERKAGSRRHRIWISDGPDCRLGGLE